VVGGRLPRRQRLGNRRRQHQPDTAAQDRADAESLYRALESEVVPRFFTRDEAGLPHDWIRTMKASIESVVSPFSAHRMVRDYFVASYLPVAETPSADSSREPRGDALSRSRSASVRRGTAGRGASARTSWSG